MPETPGHAEINGIPVDEILELRERARRDPAAAERGSTVTARWTGGDGCIVELGDKRLGVAGEGELGPMELVQAALASCVVDAVATNAALAGIAIEHLTVEVAGGFDIRGYLGLSDAPDTGYRELTCILDIRAPGASSAQLERLRDAAERASPVVNTLARAVPVRVTLAVG